jgi:stress response protein YsnF
MVSPARQEVYGPDGLIGTLPQGVPTGNTQTVVELTDGGRAVIPTAQLSIRREGGFYVPVGLQDLRRAAAATERVGAGQAVTVPVVREELAVTKQRVESGKVVVHITPAVRREVVDLPTAEEHVEVTRVPINRPVEAAQPVRQEGDVTVFAVYEEVLVIERRLMLKEEVRVSRRRAVRHEKREVELRSEEVHILREENNT